MKKQKLQAKNKRKPTPRLVLKRPAPAWKRTLHAARFLPAIAITAVASFVWAQPQFALVNSPSNNVLAYATNVSLAGLLSATNNQRQSNGVASLSSNSLLNSAAQAKANDMVNRDYWSHQTPDGQQPWVFITNAGYQYTSAGENLAYGFMTSNATVTGWMNSPPHKANLLSSSFTEVGFGIANSENYVGTGPQTVVVAMYGHPQSVASYSEPEPDPTPTPTTKPATTPSTQKPVSQEPNKPEPQTEESQAKETEKKEKEAEEEPIAIATTEQSPTSGTKNVSRIQVLTGGNAIWSTTMVILAVCAVGLLWALHHGLKLRKLIKAGENFITHHLYLDLTVLSIVFLGYVLLASSGTIK